MKNSQAGLRFLNFITVCFALFIFVQSAQAQEQDREIAIDESLYPYQVLLRSTGMEAIIRQTPWVLQKKINSWKKQPEFTQAQLSRLQQKVLKQLSPDALMQSILKSLSENLDQKTLSQCLTLLQQASMVTVEKDSLVTQEHWQKLAQYHEQAKPLNSKRQALIERLDKTRRLSTSYSMLHYEVYKTLVAAMSFDKNQKPANETSLDSVLANDWQAIYEYYSDRVYAVYGYLYRFSSDQQFEGMMSVFEQPAMRSAQKIMIESIQSVFKQARKGLYQPSTT